MPASGGHMYEYGHQWEVSAHNGQKGRKMDTLDLIPELALLTPDERFMLEADLCNAQVTLVDKKDSGPIFRSITLLRQVIAPNGPHPADMGLFIIAQAVMDRLHQGSRMYPHCVHCRSHELACDGKESLTEDGIGHTVPCAQCQLSTIAV